MEEIEYRKAQYADTDRIWEILQQAIARRKKDGSRQWQDGYPNPASVQKDIADAVEYVLTDKGRVVACAAFILNNEPSYESIDGKWLSEGNFLVIHRMAVAEEGLGRGYAKLMFELAERIAIQCSVFSIKIDTNFDNLALLAILEKKGYTYCGEISVRGMARKAFEKLLGT